MSDLPVAAFDLDAIDQAIVEVERACAHVRQRLAGAKGVAAEMLAIGLKDGEQSSPSSMASGLR